MRILLLHREDDPLAGPWTGQAWDVVFDLGRGGWAAYERWAQEFRCPVQPIDGLKKGNSEIHRVRELLQAGRGRLVDREGIDWWELTALLIHEQLERLVLLQKFSEGISGGAEVFITRDSFEARALRLMLGDRLRVMDHKAASANKGLTHYGQRIKRLSSAQILDVLGDKYDGSYRLRRYWHLRPIRRKSPVVLLPSAYVNVSLLGAAYARLLPETAFLLVSTRRSGRLRNVPANVEQEWLASYAGESSAEERRALLARWKEIQKEIGQLTELAILRQLGVMDDFDRRFVEGLDVRDAWRQVFDREPVQAVMCGDDTNPYTHIPLLLARRRGLPTVACHHGAFDGRYLFKTNYADVILAKGRMEWDYLVNVCGANPTEVEIGAPGVMGENGGSLAVPLGLASHSGTDSALKSRARVPAPHAAKLAHSRVAGVSSARVNESIPKEVPACTEEPRSRAEQVSARAGEAIVFFSEPYEVALGRTEEIYRDVLPKLVELAARCGKKVVVKLHPAESLHDRKSLTEKVLGRHEMAGIEWRTGSLSADLLQSAWFGIAVLSSVVLDCAVHGVPCFLCEWLDLWPYGYVAQYRKFGVGIGLSAPGEIVKIPDILAGWRPGQNLIADCWQVISQRRLQELLTERRLAPVTQSCDAAS